MVMRKARLGEGGEARREERRETAEERREKREERREKRE